jgi:hypothetical protein
MASVAEIDGLRGPEAPAPPPLDQYTGAAAAYSVRLLRTAYTGDIMRVRRDSDQNEIDVGFDSNDEFGLTSPVSNATSGSFTDFADFIGHGGTPANGFCRWWYDQSGNAVDAGQATSTSQPKIYDSTTGIIEEGAAGKEKPALDFDGSNDGLNCSTNLRTTTGASTVIQGRKVPSPPTSGVFYQPFVFYKVQRHLMDISAYSNVSISTNETASEYIKFSGMNVANQLLSVSTWDGSTQTGGVDEVIQYKDGAQETGTASTNSMGVSPSGTNSIGFRSDTNSQFCLGTFQEVIVWLSDQDSAGNRSGIETNINGYFQIF